MLGFSALHFFAAGMLAMENKQFSSAAEQPPRPSFTTAAVYFEALAEKTHNDDGRRQRLLEVAAFYRALARIIPGMPRGYRAKGEAAPERAERWKARAEECRTLAESFTDPTCRRQLTELAQGYEHMALTAE